MGQTKRPPLLPPCCTWNPCPTLSKIVLPVPEHIAASSWIDYWTITSWLLSYSSYLTCGPMPHQFTFHTISPKNCIIHCDYFRKFKKNYRTLWQITINNNKILSNRVSWTYQLLNYFLVSVKSQRGFYQSTGEHRVHCTSSNIEQEYLWMDWYPQEHSRRPSQWWIRPMKVCF